jgi:hypothetical protein
MIIARSSCPTIAPRESDRYTLNNDRTSTAMGFYNE